MKKVFAVLCLLIVTYSAYTQQYAFDTLVRGLRQPTVYTFLPNGNIIVNQRQDSTKIYNTTTGQKISCFWKFTDSLNTDGEAGLLGVCLDPNFAVNHYVYIYYIRTTRSSFRIVRLTENNNVGTNPVMIFNDSNIVGSPSNVHFGGNIHFGKDNKLYVTVGNHGLASNSQSLTTFKGKILRLNADGTIPADNPFYDDGNPHTGNDDRIWAYGLRNNFDFTFSPFNDSIYATENGDQFYDEINFIRKGKNYGYPICTGYCVPYNPLYRQPMDTIGGNGVFNYAPTGILIYNGSVMPELYGKLLTVGMGGGPVQGILKYELGNAPHMDTINSHSLIHYGLHAPVMLQGPGGYIYPLQYSPGMLLRMRHSTLGINDPGLPVYYSLEQNYPNPFNPVTTIKYSIPKKSFVTLQIFDVLGKELRTLVNENKQAGSYEVILNADSYSSGVYFYRLTTNEFTESKKMLIIK